MDNPVPVCLLCAGSGMTLVPVGTDDSDVAPCPNCQVDIIVAAISELFNGIDAVADLHRFRRRQLEWRDGPVTIDAAVTEVRILSKRLRELVDTFEGAAARMPGRAE